MCLKKYLADLAGKKVLVAPLDWGLGHASRCIPLINELQNSNCTIWLAGEKEQVDLLREEYPLIPILPLKGYRIRYGTSGVTGKILRQSPKILHTIRAENKWLKEQIEKYQFDAVISDNRFGLYHHQVHSIFITHQLFIKTPFGKWADRILQSKNYKFINHFNECWVPDNEFENVFAGDLSHPEKLPAIPVKYIGPLSRLKKTNTEIINDHLLVVLSGPEPQRSLLEAKIIEQLAYFPGTATVVRGLPSAVKVLPSTKRIFFYNHLSSDLMNKEMDGAEYVISRSGYSSIMDIAAMKKKSILIPTPGQPEQEYLASYLMKKQFALCISQKEFSLLQAIEKAKAFQYISNT